MKCTEPGCDKVATHLVATIVHSLNFNDYREVCKKHGRQYSKNYGYHLMRGHK